MGPLSNDKPSSISPASRRLLRRERFQNQAADVVAPQRERRQVQIILRVGQGSVPLENGHDAGDAHGDGEEQVLVWRRSDEKVFVQASAKPVQERGVIIEHQKTQARLSRTAVNAPYRLVSPRASRMGGRLSSIMAQGLHRVDAGGAPRGQPGGGKSRRNQDGGGQEPGGRIV